MQYKGALRIEEKKRLQPHQRAGCVAHPIKPWIFYVFEFSGFQSNRAHHLTPHLAIGIVQPQSLLNGHEVGGIVSEVIVFTCIPIVKGIGCFMIPLINTKIQSEFNPLTGRHIRIIEVIPIVPVLRLGSSRHACNC